MRDRWRYFVAHERTPLRRSFPYEAWQLLDNDYRYEVVRRGAFFDAEKGGIILDRFTTLEAAQRCIEERAETVTEKEKPESRGAGPPECVSES